MENQIKLLKKYSVTNYTIKEEKIFIEGDLNLSSLTSIDKDFLRGITIGGDLNLSSIITVDRDFLKETILTKVLSVKKVDGLTNKCLWSG